MTALDFELVADGFGSLEGPVVDDAGTLFVGDLKQDAVFSITSGGEVQRLLDRSHVGGIALHGSGGLVLSGDSIVHWDEGHVRELLHIGAVPSAAGRRALRFNDLVAEPGTGAVVAGVLRTGEQGEPVPGDLVRVDAAGRAAVIFEGLHPNGLAYSVDGSQLVAADTYGRRMLVFDVRAGGELSLARVFSTEPIDGLPDGIATDERGGVWVAFYCGASVVRFDIASGDATSFAMPVSKPLSVCFSGPERRQLVVVTGRHPQVGEATGGVWRARTSVAGAPVARACI